MEITNMSKEKLLQCIEENRRELEDKYFQNWDVYKWY